MAGSAFTRCRADGLFLNHPTWFQLLSVYEESSPTYSHAQTRYHTI